MATREQHMRRVSGTGRERRAQNSTHRHLRSRRRAARWMAIAPLATALWGGASLAAIVTWDANPTTPATPNDGTGNWNTTTDANWSNGVSDFTWTNGDTANIGNSGTAG